MPLENPIQDAEIKQILDLISATIKIVPQLDNDRIGLVKNFVSRIGTVKQHPTPRTQPEIKFSNPDLQEQHDKVQAHLNRMPLTKEVAAAQAAVTGFFRDADRLSLDQTTQQTADHLMATNKPLFDHFNSLSHDQLVNLAMQNQLRKNQSNSLIRSWVDQNVSQPVRQKLEKLSKALADIRSGMISTPSGMVQETTFVTPDKTMPDGHQQVTQWKAEGHIIQQSGTSLEARTLSHGEAAQLKPTNPLRPPVIKPY